MAKEPNPAKPVTSEVTPKVVITETTPPAPVEEISASTKAEMEAGRAVLKNYSK